MLGDVVRDHRHRHHRHAQRPLTSPGRQTDEASSSWWKLSVKCAIWILESLCIYLSISEFNTVSFHSTQHLSLLQTKSSVNGCVAHSINEQYTASYREHWGNWVYCLLYNCHSANDWQSTACKATEPYAIYIYINYKTECKDWNMFSFAHHSLSPTRLQSYCPLHY